MTIFYDNIYFIFIFFTLYDIVKEYKNIKIYKIINIILR